jgi:hypothetical protein
VATEVAVGSREVCRYLFREHRALRTSHTSTTLAMAGNMMRWSRKWYLSSRLQILNRTYLWDMQKEKSP